ncbi:MAG: hypothetical protein AAGF60_05435 [Pseudomonadota bacterium]
MLSGAQGSVLCQHHFRQPYGAAPLGRRTVVGCVWALDLIAFDAAAWRRHMMGSAPDLDAYLAAWATGQRGL